MYKGECSFLYMRGVFFTLFLVFCCITTTNGAKLEGQLTGLYGTEGVKHGLTLDLVKKSSWLDLGWGLKCELAEAQLTAEANWGALLKLGHKIKFLASYNREHHSTDDLFRLVTKNNFGPDSYFFGLFSEQFKLGFFRNVPLKSHDVVDAFFYESVAKFGPFTFQGTELSYAGPRERGQVQALQAGFKVGGLEALGGLGSHLDSVGTESRAIVLELNQSSNKHQISLGWQKIDAGFISPLAKANRFTPNRQGWLLQVETERGDLKLNLNIRRQHNLSFTKTYHQHSWILESKKYHTSVEWRLEPTQALILRYLHAPILLQLDALSGNLRFDHKLGKLAYSLRFDSQRPILRLELRFPTELDWRVIGKYDFLNKRLHYSVLLKFADGPRYIELELGRYDQGNITAGFHNPAHVRIVWGWKF